MSDLFTGKKCTKHHLLKNLQLHPFQGNATISFDFIPKIEYNLHRILNINKI
jgi:hypothetical protein